MRNEWDMYVYKLHKVCKVWYLPPSQKKGKKKLFFFRSAEERTILFYFSVLLYIYPSRDEHTHIHICICSRYVDLPSLPFLPSKS